MELKFLAVPDRTLKIKFFDHEYFPWQKCSESVIKGVVSLMSMQKKVCPMVGLAQSVEHLTAERKFAGSIPGAGPILRVLK